MEIKAKFKGQTSSWGVYKNGDTYKLKLSMARSHKGNDFITVNKLDGKGQVYYNTVKGFLNNWQVIGG